MAEPIFVDTEAVGLVGPTTLIQWAEGDEPVQMLHVWLSPISKTLRLIERFCNHPGGVVFFNTTYDWGELQRLYCVLREIDSQRIGVWRSNGAPSVEEWVLNERAALSGPCIKPVTTCDVYLQALKTPLQSLLARKPVYVRKVPSGLATPLKAYLERTISLDDIYFSTRKGGYEWLIEQLWEPVPGGLKESAYHQLVDLTDLCRGLVPGDNEVALEAAKAWERQAKLCGITVEQAKKLGATPRKHTGFCDLVLRFGTGSGLKRLGEYCLGRDTIEKPWPKGIMPPKKIKRCRFLEHELWTPFLEKNVEYWASDKEAALYAEQDVDLLRALFYHLNCTMGTDDSTLACAVASTRWRGFALDLDILREERDKYEATATSLPHHPSAVLKEIKAQLGIAGVNVGNTSKATLDRLHRELSKIDHPVVDYIDRVQAARAAVKLVDMCNSLIAQGGRAHLGFRVAGTKTGRMSGAGGINPQGIPGTKKSRIREAFLMAFEGEELSAGDFSGQEISILAALYDEPALTADLLTGKKYHALTGAEYFELAYEEVLADEDLYKKAKGGNFAKVYGGSDTKIAETLGITVEQMLKGSKKFHEKYPRVATVQKQQQDDFTALTQPGGIGTAVYWKDPKEYSETMSGLRRYFTLEVQCMKALFHAAQSLPSEFKSFAKVERRKGREQTEYGATVSALYGAAYSIQSSVLRQSGNAVIQGEGAVMTKNLQRRFWDLQPPGIHPWVISLMTVHDEEVVAHKASLRSEVRATLDQFLEDWKKKVPTIAMPWKENIENWAVLK